MKYRNFFTIKLSIILLATFSAQASFSREEQESLNPVNRENIKTIVEKHLRENPELLASSREKDIVVFLGKTGSGKSTLINYLSDKELKGDENGDVVLRNSLDPSAMKIGVGAESETFLPKFIKFDNFIFYDLPGFGETRGTAISLVNACFIKNIIENSHSARLVFVAGHDEVTAARGESFKNLVQIIKNLMPNDTIENISSLIITKSIAGKSKDQFINNLVLKTEPGILDSWIQGNRVTRMLAPLGEQINLEDKVEILQILNNLVPQKINKVNISAIHNLSEQNKLTEMYKAEIEELSAGLLNRNFNPNMISSLNTNELTIKKQYFQNRFIEDVLSSLNTSAFINLLRPISEELYSASWNSFRNTLSLKSNQIVGQIDVEIKDREKKAAEEQARIQAENARRAQEQARIQAENARIAQEQTRIQAENARRAQEQARIHEENARINNPANWPVKTERVEEVSTYWGNDFLGDWEEYRGGSGWSRRTKHRKQYYQREMRVTVTKERRVAYKADGTQSVIHQNWHDVSRNEGPTGNTRATGRFEY